MMATTSDMFILCVPIINSKVDPLGVRFTPSNVPQSFLPPLSFPPGWHKLWGGGGPLLHCSSQSLRLATDWILSPSDPLSLLQRLHLLPKHPQQDFQLQLLSSGRHRLSGRGAELHLEGAEVFSSFHPESLWKPGKQAV